MANYFHRYSESNHNLLGHRSYCRMKQTVKRVISIDMRKYSFSFIFAIIYKVINSYVKEKCMKYNAMNFKTQLN